MQSVTVDRNIEFAINRENQSSIFKNLDLLRITFSINVAGEASVSKDYRRISDI